MFVINTEERGSDFLVSVCKGPVLFLYNTKIRSSPSYSRKKKINTEKRGRDFPLSQCVCDKKRRKKGSDFQLKVGTPINVPIDMFKEMV